MTDTLIPDREEAASELAGLRLRTDLFIDGEFRPANDGRRFVTENPATGRSIADVAEGGAADIDAAVGGRAARSTDGRVVAAGPADRKRVLLALGRPDRGERARSSAMIESLDAGKPITDTASLDLPETVKTIRWYAEAIDKLYDAVAPTGRDALGHDHPRADRGRRCGPAVELPGS